MNGDMHMCRGGVLAWVAQGGGSTGAGEQSGRERQAGLLLHLFYEASAVC